MTIRIQGATHNGLPFDGVRAAAAWRGGASTPYVGTQKVLTTPTRQRGPDPSAQLALARASGWYNGPRILRSYIASKGSTAIDRSVLDRWTLLAVLAVGVWMFWAAGYYTVFDDEAFSCRRYAMPVAEMVSALWHGVEPDPPLYYLLQNVWVRVFGVGPLGLRSMSMLFFLAGLVVLRSAAASWLDRRTALATMILAALHPAHLFFGFAARWYSLVFFLVALLLWLTARLASADREVRGWAAGWCVAAAALCYANYFGFVVAGACWAAGVLRGRHRAGAFKYWALAGLGALMLHAPWFPASLRTAASFPSPDWSWLSLAAAAARTTMALLAGNLASIGAWWVWVPLGVFSAAMVVPLVGQWRTVWPAALITIACLAVGVLSRAMIDKYVMSFSGAACLLAAGLLVQSFRRGTGVTARLWASAAVVGLVVGWIGCGINLATQSNWSSLRWLDPFERAVADLAARKDVPPRTQWVLTHPSARYYFACRFAGAAGSNDAGQRRQIDAESWRRHAEPPSASLENVGLACATPTSILAQMEAGPVQELVTLETAGFCEPADDWGELYALLERSFKVTDERAYLEDLDAAWKDRLDPTVRHPRWRITVRCWKLSP